MLYFHACMCLFECPIVSSGNDVHIRSLCVKKIQSIQPMKRFNNAFELHQIIWAIHQVYHTIIYKQIRQLYKRLIKQISCINVGNSENQSSIHNHIIDKSYTLNSLRFRHSRLLLYRVVVCVVFVVGFICKESRHTIDVRHSSDQSIVGGKYWLLPESECV